MLGALLVAGAVVSACSDSGGPGATDADDVVDLFGLETGRADAPEPLLALLPAFEHPDATYAWQLLVRECMAESGYSTAAVRPFPSRVFDARTHERRFDADLAAELGYSLDPAEDRHDWATALAEAPVLDAAGQERKSECGEAAVAELDLPDLGIASQLISSSHEEARASVARGPAAERWIACMADVGVSDLPGSPFEMPPASVVPLVGGADLPARSPSTREIEVAVADARCRRSSGFDDALRKRIAELQLEGIAANLDAFTALRDASEPAARRIDETVASLGD